MKSSSDNSFLFNYPDFIIILLFSGGEKLIGKYICSECHRSYSTQYVLNRHLKKIHCIEKQGKSVCPLCDAPVRMGRNFTDHLKELHNVDVDTEEIIFDSLEGMNYLLLCFYQLNQSLYYLMLGFSLF